MLAFHQHNLAVLSDEGQADAGDAAAAVEHCSTTARHAAEGIRSEQPPSVDIEPASTSTELDRPTDSGRVRENRAEETKRGSGIVIDRGVIPTARLDAKFSGQTLASLSALGVQAYDATQYDEAVIEQAQAQIRESNPSRVELPMMPTTCSSTELVSLPPPDAPSTEQAVSRKWRIPSKLGRREDGKRPISACYEQRGAVPVGSGKATRRGDVDQDEEQSEGESQPQETPQSEREEGELDELAEERARSPSRSAARLRKEPMRSGVEAVDLDEDAALAQALSSQRSGRMCVARRRAGVKERSDEAARHGHQSDASYSPSHSSSSGDGEGSEESEEDDLGDEVDDLGEPSSARRATHHQQHRGESVPRAHRRKAMANASVYTLSDEEAEDEDLGGGWRVPGKLWKRLFAHQRTCVEWLLGLHQENVGGIVGDEMGLGKTLQIIALFATLHAELQCGPCLVVAPATVLRQWQREFKRWAPWIERVLLLHGSEANEEGDRLQALRKVTDVSDGCCSVLITTYEMVRINAAALLSKRWHYVVLDEGHKIRNPDAEITQVCKRFNTPHRLILTGAPIQNRLTELWSLFDFVFPGKLGTLPVFQEQFSLPISMGAYANASNFKVQAAYQCSLVLRDIIRPYLLRRLKSDVDLKLPDKSEQVLFCQLTDEQLNAYEQFLQGDLVRKVLASNMHAFAALSTVLKICNHPHLYNWDEEEHEEGVHYGDWQLSGKMHVLKEVLHMWHRHGDRALIFCQTRQMLDIVQAFVSTRYSFRRLDGTTPVGARLRLIDEFNTDDSIFLFLLTTRAGGLGINLTGANRVVLLDPDWNPANDSQARERAYRVGQTRSVQIFRLVTAGTLEEKVYQRQVFKQFLSNNVLKDPKLSRRVFKPSDLRDLLAPPAVSSALAGTQTGDLFAQAERLPTMTNRSEGGAWQRDGKVNASKDGDYANEKRSGIARTGSSSSLVTSKHNASQPSSSDKETGLLQQLLDGAIVGSSLNHDLVCNGDMRHGSTTIAEARQVAQRAAEALRQSHERRASESIRRPTWTGQSGSAGISSQLRFGGAFNSQLLGRKSSSVATDSGTEASANQKTSFFSQGQARKTPVGSSALFQRIKERKESETTLFDSKYNADAEAQRLSSELRDFLKANHGRCTSEQLTTRFKHQTVDAVLFRQLLRELARKDQSGRWVLAEEYR